MSELDDLTKLLKSPGWLRLGEFARSQWTDQLGRHVSQASDDRDDLVALNKLRQVVAAQKAIEALLSWPAERIARLEQVVAQERAPMSLSRRGGL